MDHMAIDVTRPLLPRLHTLLTSNFYTPSMLLGAMSVLGIATTIAAMLSETTAYPTSAPAPTSTSTSATSVSETNADRTAINQRVWGPRKTLSAWTPAEIAGVMLFSGLAAGTMRYAVGKFSYSRILQFMGGDKTGKFRLAYVFFLNPQLFLRFFFFALLIDLTNRAWISSFTTTVSSAPAPRPSSSACSPHTHTPWHDANA
jgi:hypothetical protein